MSSWDFFFNLAFLFIGEHTLLRHALTRLRSGRDILLLILLCVIPLVLFLLFVSFMKRKSKEEGGSRTPPVDLQAPEPPPGDQERPRDSAPDLWSGIGERILLVEDEESLRELSERMLRNFGYDVFSCGSLQEAFEIYEQEGERVRLLITDVVLPDGNGVELADRLKTKDPSLSVLLTSGYSEILSQWEPFREKEMPFLQKPFGMNDLLRAVQTVLDMDPGQAS
jgi:CheY-like chemotaxis protein